MERESLKAPTKMQYSSYYAQEEIVELRLAEGLAVSRKVLRHEANHYQSNFHLWISLLLQKIKITARRQIFPE